MSRPIVVGYTATVAGADALAVAARLARVLDAPLEVVTVLPDTSRSVITPPDAGYGRIVREHAERWLSEALSRLRAAVSSRGSVRSGESFAEGLVAAANALDAAYLVVGAANGGLGGAQGRARGGEKGGQ